MEESSNLEPTPNAASDQSALVPAEVDSDVALVLTGGGARAAYQVGFLRCLARNRPRTRFPIVTGVSAGAINAAYLAAHPGNVAKAAAGLEDLWGHLDPEEIYRVGMLPLLGNMLRWGATLFSGGARPVPEPQSILDVSPLRALLDRTLATKDGAIVGIERNLAAGKLKALALSTLKYSTGQTVTWVQGRDFDSWERPLRIGAHTKITIEHVMASAALPLMFPAVKIGGSWYGDGGIRLSAPLAPAIHLGAGKILAIATRQDKSVQEASQPTFTGYPPPAQVAGTMLNAAFLDAIDQDMAQLERINNMLARIPDGRYRALRRIQTLVLRPSQDLGRLAADFEVKLPRAFRFFTRGWGTRETRSPDFLSLLMFQSDYLRALMDIGDQDAHDRMDEIQAFFESD